MWTVHKSRLGWARVSPGNGGTIISVLDISSRNDWMGAYGNGGIILLYTERRARRRAIQPARLCQLRSRFHYATGPLLSLPCHFCSSTSLGRIRTKRTTNSLFYFLYAAHLSRSCFFLGRCTTQHKPSLIVFQLLTGRIQCSIVKISPTY